MVVYTYKVNVNSLAQIICIMEFDEKYLSS